MKAMRQRPGCTARSLARAAVLGCVAISAAGCVTTGSGETTGSISPAASAAPRSDADWRREADGLAERYRANPRDANTAIAYARALTALGERTQASSVLQQAS